MACNHAMLCCDLFRSHKMSRVNISIRDLLGKLWYCKKYAGDSVGGSVPSKSALIQHHGMGSKRVSVIGGTFNYNNWNIGSWPNTIIQNMVELLSFYLIQIPVWAMTFCLSTFPLQFQLDTILRQFFFSVKPEQSYWIYSPARYS